MLDVKCHISRDNILLIAIIYILNKELQILIKNIFNYHNLYFQCSTVDVTD